MFLQPPDSEFLQGLFLILREAMGRVLLTLEYPRDLSR